jgi:multidrug efflux pump subunit AcrA (membrane-fusion protein)
MLDYIEIGQRAEISTPSLSSASVSAKLSRISPFLHPVTHSTDAEIDLSNTNHYLKPGMFVTADIFYGESEQATIIPLSALYENPLTGATGVYVCRDTLNRVPVEPLHTGETGSLTEPVPFEFVSVEVIAKGRMNAGISNIEPGSWVVTIGQDLLGGESGEAKVRPVDWNWVQRLQNLQREDLLQEIIRKKQTD